MAKAPADIRSLARAHTERAIQVLAGIMGADESPPAARVSAAQALLDRGWGRPEQTILGDLEVRHYVSRIPAPSNDITDWQNKQTALITKQ